MSDTETIEAPTLAPDDGDHERLKHYYFKKDLDKAWLAGQPIRAVCGKVDVPLRDPDRYPLCGSCKEFWEAAQDA